MEESFLQFFPPRHHHFMLSQSGKTLEKFSVIFHFASSKDDPDFQNGISRNIFLWEKKRVKRGYLLIMWTQLYTDFLNHILTIF